MPNCINFVAAIYKNWEAKNHNCTTQNQMLEINQIAQNCHKNWLYPNFECFLFDEFSLGHEKHFETYVYFHVIES